MHYVGAVKETEDRLMTPLKFFWIIRPGTPRSKKFFTGTPRPGTPRPSYKMLFYGI